MLLNVIIEQLISDRDPELGGAVQLSGVLRLLIDPENMLAALNKSEKADFLNLFYKQSMSLLIGKIASSFHNILHITISTDDITRCGIRETAVWQNNNKFL